MGMVQRVATVAFEGIEARSVTVQVQVAPGLPAFNVVGLGDKAVSEAREREICDRLGPALRERGLLFTGIDVIDGYLTEINVTSPTGIRAIRKLGGPDIAAMIWDKIEAKRAG